MTERVPLSLPPETVFVPIVEPVLRHSISAIDRAVRRRALTDIFEILGATTCLQRLHATRQILVAISIHHHDASRLVSEKDTLQRKIFERAATHAEALAVMARAYPTEFGLYVMGERANVREKVDEAYAMLHSWEVHSRRMAAIKPRKHRDLGPVILIHWLAPFYEAATGRSAGRGADRNHRKHSRFVYFMHAVWRLSGVAKTHGAIERHIRDWKDMATRTRGVAK